MRIHKNQDAERPSLAGASAEELALAMAKFLWKRMALDIALYKVDTTTVVADYYIICTGRSNTHMRNTAEELMYEMEMCGIPDSRLEGKFGSTWFLVDFGSVIVHIFDRESREYYHLDHLMGEEQKIPLQFEEDEDETEED